MDQRQQLVKLAGVVTVALAATCAVWWYQRRQRQRRCGAAAAAATAAGGSATATGASGRPILGRMTVVITTSPVKSNPSTAMFERLMDHFAHVPELRNCRKIIMCDGCKIGDKDKFRAGKVTAEGAQRYAEYVANLRRLVAKGDGYFANSEVVALETRGGFGNAVKASLELVDTPYIMVVQHDRSFMTHFPVEKVLERPPMRAATAHCHRHARARYAPCLYHSFHAPCLPPHAWARGREGARMGARARCTGLRVAAIRSRARRGTPTGLCLSPISTVPSPRAILTWVLGLKPRCYPATQPIAAWRACTLSLCFGLPC